MIKDFPLFPEGAQWGDQIVIDWLNKIRNRLCIDYQNTVTPATGDEVALFDVSASVTGKATLSAVLALGGGGGSAGRTFVDSQKTLPASGAYWNAISYGMGTFLIVANGSDAAATSPTGNVWTAQTMPASRAWDRLANNGTVFCSIEYNTVNAATSPDGAVWTARTLALASTGPVVSNGSGFVSLITSGSSRSTQTSPTGAVWTAHANALPVTVSSWYNLAFGGGIYCALSLGESSTSADGITWSSPVTLPATKFWDVTHNGSIFCAISSGDLYGLTSPDGSTWTLQTLPDPSPEFWHDAIAWDGTNFCIITVQGGRVAFSPDGATWTMQYLSPAPLSIGANTGSNNPCMASDGTIFFVPSSGDDIGLAIMG